MSAHGKRYNEARATIDRETTTRRPRRSRF
jgi:hypothetical protein